MPHDLLVAVKLAKEGFGSVESILNQPTALVLASLEYCNFRADYERARYEAAKNK